MSAPLPKPAELFDRDAEWSDLATFATSDRLGATLAVVYGRRRQGKTLLLELLAEQTGGFMVSGLEQSSAQNLEAVGRAYAAHAGLQVPVAFRTWEEVVDALFALGEDGRPATVVLDELPYLQKTAPEIPSLIQRALSPRGTARRQSRTRLVLCGSAFSVMAGLLTGTAPLRGRATREILVSPFDFREAAAFWGVLDQPDLAIRLHALVGGTPAYRDFCDGDLPDHPDALDPWVARQLLNPSSAFFREGRSLLAEEPEMNDLGLYSSVLGAIAAGRIRRSQIADAVGRKETALAHPLSVLREARLVYRQADAIRANRPTFHISEPMLRLHQLVVAPNEARLARRQGTQVWAELADTVQARIYGPHFEELARQWTAHYASPRLSAARPVRSGPPSFPAGTTTISTRWMSSPSSGPPAGRRGSSCSAKPSGATPPSTSPSSTASATSASSSPEPTRPPGSPCSVRPASLLRSSGTPPLLPTSSWSTPAVSTGAADAFPSQRPTSARALTATSGGRRTRACQGP